MGYRYIGTKSRIIDALLKKITEITGEGARVADLMCGTGSVSAALRENGFAVTANDVMTYSYHHARVSLLFTIEPKFASASDFVERYYEPCESLLPLSPYELMLNALNHIPPERGYFFREFCLGGRPANNERPRNYFSAENAERIDAIRLWIIRLHKEEAISDLEHSLLLHDLIMAANDVANIAGTYGHYLSKLLGRAKDKLALKPSTFLLLSDSGRHKVFQDYAENIAEKIECDLCYIDPPYMKRQYAANYHILETIAREDEPDAIGVSGLRPWRDQYSNFCTKTRIRDSFRRIFSTMKCSNYLISYSEDGLLSLDELLSLFQEFGKVDVSSFPIKRFKSNSSKRSTYLTEYMLHLELA